MELDPRAEEERRRVLARLVRWIDHTDLVRSMRRVTEAAARSLGVTRVGVWLFDEHRGLLRCVDLFDASLRVHTSGAELTAADYPVYFDALLTERDLAASDALADPRTRELAEVYLRPLGITAMLDVPLWVGGHMVGVICHEHVGGASRRWTHADQAFAASIGDLTALAVEASERYRVADTLREREAELREARTLEALGQVVAGVAGDFRQVVAEVLAGADELKARVPPDDAVALGQLARLRASAEQASSLARRLCELGRPVVEPEVVDLGSLLQGMVPVLEHILGSDVRLRTSVAPGGCDVLAGRHQLEQILLNLALNARDAMPGGGELEVTISAGAADEAPRRVVLTVSDTGAGATAEVPERLFEPLSSVAPPGHGPAFWRALVQGLVTASGGRMEAESTPGQGSVFRVELPWAEPARQPAPHVGDVAA